MKAVIHARYSADGQNPLSVDDQIAECKKYVNRKYNGIPTTIFSDSAKTGRTMDRHGLRSILSYVDLHAPEVVAVSEGLDRLSRNLKDIATIYQHCSELRVKILINYIFI